MEICFMDIFPILTKGIFPFLIKSLRHDVFNSNLILFHARNNCVISFFAIFIFHSLKQEVSVIYWNLVYLSSREILVYF